MSDELPRNSSGQKNRVLVLCGPNLTHKNTCATLIRAGLNVVGICEADQRTGKLPLRYVLRSVQKKGFWLTFSRVAARLVYQCMNWRKDRAAYARLFDAEALGKTLRDWAGPIHRTPSFSEPETLEWIRECNPDVLVVHCPYWVGKKARETARKKIVLGGHPGLTPYYRGSHSAFWAIYSGKPQDVGCTVFLLDHGVDTGDIVAQERIPIGVGDSFFTLAWKGAIRIAQLQAAVLRDLDDGIPLPQRRLPVPENSEFDNPTLGEFVRYRLRQLQVR